MGGGGEGLKFQLTAAHEKNIYYFFAAVVSGKTSSGKPDPVGTSYIVKCNVSNMYIPYNLHYTVYAYVAVYNPNQVHQVQYTTPISIQPQSGPYSSIQPYTGLYRHTQPYTALHISLQPYTTLHSPILSNIAYATLPVYKSIYDTIQFHTSL